MRAIADAGMARPVFFFFFLSNWDGAPLVVGALRKLLTLRIGSGGTACMHSFKACSFNRLFGNFMS